MKTRALLPVVVKTSAAPLEQEEEREKSRAAEEECTLSAMLSEEGEEE